MTSPIAAGIYEDLITNGLRVELEKLNNALVANHAEIDPADIPRVLSRYASGLLSQVLESLNDDDREEVGTRLVNRVIAEISAITDSSDVKTRLIEESPKILTSVSKALPDGSSESIARPILALGDTTFLTNAKGEPQLLKQIQSEIGSATSIDILMAFVRWAGVRPLLAPIRRLIESGHLVRLITTTYTNSTEQRALDALVQAGAQVKVSYDVTQTRLHAKAWLFTRDRGLSTAYIGSSNMTASAMVDGVEWNVRVSEVGNADIIQKFRAVFESYWQSPDYKRYDPAEFGAAVARAGQLSNSVDISPFLIEPRPFQQRLLDDVSASRSAGFHRNLVVAATGTGKTVMSAFDYLSLTRRLRPARLLFVAHRKEILGQSRRMFAQIMQDPGFGEMWVDGERPSKFDHVFASIQTLANQDLESISPDFYDVIIIDEAHHVAASTYQRILKHFKPRELVGLTATPERGDGHNILRHFDDRIAAELRIWEAIEQQYLSPFAYFGIRDEADLSAVTWKRGMGYDLEELTNVYTANDQWVSLVIQQVHQKILDPSTMRALGFCVGIKHAEFMAKQFNRVGIKSVVLTGGHESPERAAAIRDLSSGQIQAIFTVDIFNEGIDIPSVDTLLLLRPTDSGLLFIQQIGRGLRKAKDKQLCTILDFVGHHRKEFRYENRFRALVGGTRRELERQVREGFPLLPAGCQIHLDAHSQTEILDSLKNAVPSQWLKMVAELKRMGDVSFRGFLLETGLTLEDLYSRNRTYAELRRAAGFDPTEPTEQEVPLLRGVARLNHIDDTTRIRTYREWLSRDRPPALKELSVHDRRLVRMMSASVTSALKLDSAEAELDLMWKFPAVLRELNSLLEVREQIVDVVHPEHDLQPEVPLRVHALYSRTEIQAALDDLKKDGKIKEFREGVRYIEPSKTDIFLFTADKSSSGFSPTTRYRDYAISSTLVHWESQSTISSSSPTGRRYIEQKSNGTTILLFGRHSKSDDAFWFLGPATYVTHSGEYPIAFTWKLRYELPAALFSLFAAAA
jgi:superfamily II DNA or RNA helicase/HKD family nuclease